MDRAKSPAGSGAPAAGARGPKRASASTRAMLENLRIMVVDDNRHMRMLIKGILLALGCRNVVEAADGADALKELRLSLPDIILTDMNMSPLDGIDFTRLVRTGRDSADPFVPIILITAHTEAYRILDARDAGVNEILAKPISAQSLYARLHAIIFNPRPYVRCTHYFGPDRRRKGKPWKGEERRKVPTFSR